LAQIGIEQQVDSREAPLASSSPQLLGWRWLLDEDRLASHSRGSVYHDQD